MCIIGKDDALNHDFIKAIQRFDTSFEVRLSTYAVPYILGEIKRFIRDDGPIKVSRSIKELNDLSPCILLEQNLFQLLNSITSDNISQQIETARALEELKIESVTIGRLDDSRKKYQTLMLTVLQMVYALSNIVYL